MNLAIKVGPSVRLLNVGFASDQMQIIAAAAATAVESRWSRGQNVYDLPAKPLAAAYGRRKIKKTGSGVRNMRLTGALIAAHGPTRIGANYAVVGFSTQSESAKAWINQEIEPMFGLSPNDKAVIAPVIEELHDMNVANMKVRA